MEIEIRYDDIPSTSVIEMFTGETGCGKTYKMINNNDNLVIAVPTRQLAYEIFLDYPKMDFINTGEVHIVRNEQKKNGVVVYENLCDQMIDDYDTIIVDECHFISDEQRGGELLNKIIYALAQYKKVVFGTATNTLCAEMLRRMHIKEVRLTPFVNIKKTEIKDLDEMIKIASKNPTLVFTKYAPTEEDVNGYANLLNIPLEKSSFISANVPSSERVAKQIAFKNGDLQLMVSSNVLAQGVNFPAVCVLIEYNIYDDWEIMNQKIGRAGRPNMSTEAYYLIYEIPEKNVRPPIHTFEKNIIDSYRDIDISSWNISPHEIPTDIYKYKGFKYSKRFLTLLEKNNLINNDEKKALYFLEYEEIRLRKILLNQDVKKINEAL